MNYKRVLGEYKCFETQNFWDTLKFIPHRIPTTIAPIVLHQFEIKVFTFKKIHDIIISN
jgi:hypothetical protein